ncbi:MAG TPA: 50S ribosomal protein L23 [Syntrophales bacterium]|nr:50S ribosomal protein L23 [Syntrophales bacterium]HOL58891.1 50S ribosomal protein L23 [Syntrophales bacterium]HPO35218.1 50S ribosomal protein L23 [Syntrophales bacterium]
MEPYDVIKKVLLTEKSTMAKDAMNKYTFAVDRRANKIDIARAVELLFKVKVMDVHTMNFEGKKKRVGRIIGQRSNWKKAVVTLAEGSRIELYEGV